MIPDADADLWMIVAIIQPFKLDAVTLALEQVPEFGGMTVSTCRGFGHAKLLRERAEMHSGRKARDHGHDVTDFKDQLRLEIAVSSQARADALVHVIADAAHTGREGDGKVFMWPIARAVRIRNFDENNLAL